MLVQTDDLLTVRRTLRLVEHAKDLVQTVVYLSLQQGNLNDDAVVHQTVDEGVLLAVLYHIAVVVQGLVAGVHHRFRYVADAVPQKIDGYHRNGVPLFLSRLLYILFRIVLCGKVAAET